MTADKVYMNGYDNYLSVFCVVPTPMLIILYSIMNISYVFLMKAVRHLCDLNPYIIS